MRPSLKRKRADTMMASTFLWERPAATGMVLVPPVAGANLHGWIEQGSQAILPLSMMHDTRSTNTVQHECSFHRRVCAPCIPRICAEINSCGIRLFRVSKSALPYRRWTTPIPSNPTIEIPIRIRSLGGFFARAICSAVVLSLPHEALFSVCWRCNLKDPACQYLRARDMMKRIEALYKTQ